MTHIQKHISLSMGIFFGWLLSVPFNGPVMNAWLLSAEYTFPLPLIFMFTHALGLLILGITISRAERWSGLILYGGGLSLALGLLVPFSPLGLWPLLYSLLGFTSAMFILGWSFPYTVAIDANYRMQQMALTIILSNIIYIFFSILLTIFTVEIVYYISLLFLAGSVKAALLLTKLDLPTNPKEYIPQKTVAPPPPFSQIFILVICLLIFGLYINGGLMYQVMYPSLAKYESIAVFYRHLPYITVLALMWFFGSIFPRQFLIYLGVSLLGLAFIAFSLLYQTMLGFFMIETLIQASFALLDLFFFTLLGDLASISGTSFKIFGFGLSATVGAILVGALLGEQIITIGENYNYFTALLALATILLTFLVIPWISRSIEGFHTDSSHTSNSYYEHQPLAQPMTNMEHFESIFWDSMLTAREKEITEQLLLGLTNKEIAAQLYVSENTLKTHLKKIYQKLEVKGRREIMSRVLKQKEATAYNQD